jgi:hypothetical protein
MDLREIVREDGDWIHIAQDRDPLGSIKGSEFLNKLSHYQFLKDSAPRS